MLEKIGGRREVVGRLKGNKEERGGGREDGEKKTSRMVREKRNKMEKGIA